MTATLTLDKAGRVVLPKRLRDHLHLHAGSILRAEIVGDKIELAEEASSAQVIHKKDGLPVIIGWEGFDAAKAVRDMREDQVARLTPPAHP
jgi:AbrB family looped-hinge helix DNA binding protein